MEQTSLGHHPISSKEKKCMKSNGFWNIETRMRVPILRGMERIPHFRSIVGTRPGIFRRWRPPDQLQAPPSSMNTPAVITLPLSTFKNMKMEQMWRLDDCLGQARRAWRFFEWYKNYLTTEEFPETSFPLLLHSTYQHIQTIHQQNVDLLWSSFFRILPLTNTPYWLLLNFLDFCWTRKWTLL